MGGNACGGSGGSFVALLNDSSAPLSGAVPLYVAGGASSGTSNSSASLGEPLVGGAGGGGGASILDGGCGGGGFFKDGASVIRLS